MTKNRLCSSLNIGRARAQEWSDDALVVAEGYVMPHRIVAARIGASIELWRKAMLRFTVGARVRVAEDKSTDRVGTIIEVLPRAQRTGHSDHYRVEFTDGTIKELSDLQLSPAGSGPTIPKEDVA